MSSNPAPWTPFCGVTGNSHENLVYCFSCHGRNPEIAYNTSSSARSRDIIEIDSAPARSSITTMSHMAPRFGSYNRQGAESIRQSQPLRHTPVRRGNRGGSVADARSPSTYHAVVSFYMLSYQLSEGDDSEVIAEATSAQLLQRTAIRVPSRTIDSIEDFITTDLLPDVCRPGRYVRRPTDRLRLATAVNKLEPVYISQSADCRQASDDLLKNWFHTSGQGREFNIFVVIEREVNGPNDHKEEKNERRTTLRREKSKSPRRNGGLDSRREKSKSPRRNGGLDSEAPLRKRSFSDLSTTSSAYSLPTPEEVLSGLSSGPARVRTRQRYELDEEDLERIVNFN